MHPRKDLWPLRDTTFHVMNSGCSSRPRERGSVGDEKREERELSGVPVPDAVALLRLDGVDEEPADFVEDDTLLLELATLGLVL